MELEKNYQLHINAAQHQLDTIKKRILQISTCRVILFLAGIVEIVYFYHQGTFIIAFTIAITFILFLVLVKYHTSLFRRKEWLEILIQINKDEITALNNDYSAFDEGAEFIDSTNLYTFDLDIFGNHSLFQLLNRTCTHFGKKSLAQWLQKHSESKEEIEKRQAAAKELAQKERFREIFRITGLLNKGKEYDATQIKQWSETPLSFSQKSWSRPLTIFVPTTNLLLFVLGLFHIISFNWFGFSFILFLISSSGLTKSVSLFQSVYDKHLKVLSTYAKLIHLIDEEKMHAELLMSYKNKLYCDNGKRATDALKELEKEMNRLDLRNNQILYILLEGLFFWQLRQVLRIEQWKQQYGRFLMQWLNALGEIDALCSIGNFAYNHPNYHYPILSDKPFIFKATELGHPLMPKEECVTNDVTIPSQPFFIIITGANMAGKSTYLRTIGINYVLACVGAPTYSTSLEIYPAKLITSLRTTDSLNKNESYFFAELKRLKEIIDRLHQGEQLFIILDEILKGTNSLDKQKGSFALIQQFMQLQASGIIATHDLMLGNLALSFPETIKNFCFEADITGDELTFSYKLRSGIAQNMNACFLMKKMGINMPEV